MSYQSINPYTMKKVKSFDPISDAALDRKLEAAGHQFKEWRESPLKERTGLLDRMAEILEEKGEVYAETITAEMGKPISQARAEVDKCALLCRYFADNGPSFLSPVEMPSSGRHSRVQFDPLGIILAIMPWNFPFWQVFRFLVPNLMAGNVMLLKHASNVPLCALAIEDVVQKAGAGGGLFQNLFISHAQIDQIARQPLVRGVTLTGSNPAGYQVAELAGSLGKKTVLELGGSDPYVVFEDADPDQALETAIMARFQNNGQSCIAAKRMFIQDSIFDDFTMRFKKAVEKIKTGDPMEKDTLLGPLARKDLLAELEDQIRRSIQQGGKVICGGRPIEEGSLVMQATLITGLPYNAKVLQEEWFGPVIPLIPFEDEAQALQMVNHTPFGLGASVWTLDREKAERMARRIESGTVTINGMVRSEPGLPFGGIKASGYGRELAEYGMKEFVNVKTVSFF